MEAGNVFQLTWYTYALTPLGASSNKYGFKAVFSQVVYGEIRSYWGVVLYFNATLGDVVNLTLDDLTGQTELRYSHR
ncbi:hypothetical protein ES703_91231 [subsurface metagenome]